jgi:hypothetical protein
VLALSAVDASLGAFDTILVLRNNLGLAGPHGDAARLLRRLAAITTERGRIVTDSVDPDRLADPAFRTYRPDAGTRLRAQRYRVRFRKYATPWFHYLMVSPAELEQLVGGAGWRLLRLLDDGSPRYIAVLEKASSAAKQRALRQERSGSS